MSENLDLDNIWKQTLVEIKKSVNKATFFTLFKDTSLVSIQDEIALIAAPSKIAIDMLQKKCLQEITGSLETVTGDKHSVVFTTRIVRPTTTSEGGPLFAQVEQASSSIGHLPKVRPDYTFENFAVSSSNELAYVSAQTNAIANKSYFSKPDLKIIYLTSEEFTNEVVEAIRTNDTGKMKRRLRGAQLLLIDDIQFVEGKERIQEELFHTFNHLRDNGSQICLSSDRPPRNIKKLENRLSSRFSEGLIVDISAPDLELKTAILGIKAEKYNTRIPTDVAMYLAEQVTDTRSLEGLLLRLITLSNIKGLNIDLALAKMAVGENILENKSRLHPDDIIDGVCSFYSIKSTQLKGPKRDSGLVRARQVCMYMLKNELGLTYAEIGNLLGGRDHTTIMHGVDKISVLVENKANVSRDIFGITRIIRE
jgi:chromosomal replication initiator protein